MPAKSDVQQQAAGAALAAKRGEMNPDELFGASREMYESMTEQQLHDLAATSREDIPERVTPRRAKRAKKRAAAARTKKAKRSMKKAAAKSAKKAKKAKKKAAPKKAAKKRAAKKRAKRK
jgi:hypothetical protein